MNDSGDCSYCGQPHATEDMGEDERGNRLFVHHACEERYVRRLLGRPLSEAQRLQMLRGNADDVSNLPKP